MERKEGHGRPGAPTSKEQAKQKITEGKPLLSPVEQQISDKSRLTPSGEAHTKLDREYIAWLEHWEPEPWRTGINPDPKFWYERHKKSQEKIEKRKARQRRYYHKNKEKIQEYRRHYRQKRIEQHAAELTQGEEKQPEISQIFPSPPKE